MSLAAAATEDTQWTKPSQKFEGHGHDVNSVICVPDRQRIMTCSNDGSLGVWNLQTGQQIESWRDGRSGVYVMALSMDGKNVAGGSYDGVIRLWDMETGKMITKWVGHTNTVTSLCWNQDGGQVLSGSTDGTTRVWDAETGTFLDISTGFVVYAAIFSPDSTLIAIGGNNSDDQSIKVGDADTGALVAILKGHSLSVNCLVWTVDGRTLISGSFDSSIRTWDTSTWQPLTVFTGHTESVHGIALSPDGRILASVSWDNTAQLWNLENGQPISLPLQHPNAVNSVSFSTDGTLLATGCCDKNAYTWDVSAIMNEVGLGEPLDGEKSFLDADATLHPVEESENSCPLPDGFFSESSHNPDIAITRPISPLSVPRDALSEVQLNSPEPRVSMWSPIKSPVRSIFLQWARLLFFTRPQRHNAQSKELHERPIVDVPLAQGLLRIANADGVRRMKEKKKEKKKYEDEMEKATQAETAKSTKNVATASTQNNITRQSAGLSQVHSSLEPDLASPTTPADATPITLHIGCCTPFLLCIGRASAAQQSDGRH